MKVLVAVGCGVGSAVGARIRDREAGNRKQGGMM